MSNRDPKRDRDSSSSSLRFNNAPWFTKRGGPTATPLSRLRLQLLDADPATPGAPDVDADEQEQPDHVDEMPVPGGEFEAEMLGWGKMAAIGTDQADDQEDRPDQHVEAVETGRHEEGGAIDVAGEAERGVGIFPGLHAGEARTQQDGQDQPV